MKILVIRAGALGDVILTLPVLRVLREHFPRAHIEVMGYPATLGWIQGQGCVDAIRSIEQGSMASFFVRDGSLPEDLRTYFGRFDWILLYSQDQEGVFSENLRRAGARQVISWPAFSAAGERVHENDHLLKALRGLGIEVDNRTPCIHLTDADRATARIFWEKWRLHDQPVFVIHPGSGGRSKCWMPERFARIGDELVTAYGGTVLVLKGPADEEQVHEMTTYMNTPFIVVEGRPVLEVAGMLERATLFLGNDSGITHLAVGVGAPTITLFGPTDPAVWAPRGDHVVVLHRPVPCAPCTREERLRCPHRRCVEAISVEDVQQAIVRLLDRKRSGRSLLFTAETATTKTAEKTIKKSPRASLREALRTLRALR